MSSLDGDSVSPNCFFNLSVKFSRFGSGISTRGGGTTLGFSTGGAGGNSDTPVDAVVTDVGNNKLLESPIKV